MLYGIDIGNAKTKITTSLGQKCFDSRINQGTSIMNKNVYNISIGNSQYTVGGSKGEMNMNPEKFKKDFHNILMYTSICTFDNNSNDDKIKAKIVTGIPIGYFKDSRKEYKERLLNVKKQLVIVNDIPKIVTIEDCIVFPQSAIVWSNTNKYKNYKTLVADIGGGTFDISLWDGLELEEGKSYSLGCYIELYDNIATAINGFYKTNYSPIDVEGFLNKEYVFDNNRNKINLTDIKETYINSFYRKITNTLSTFYNIGNVDNLIITGGGANIVKDLFKKDYNNIEVNCNKYVNSQVYYNVGIAKGFDK